MRNINIYIILAFVFILSSCEKDFTNKNQITNDQVYSTEAGIVGATVGMTEHFANSSYGAIVEIPGITTREIGITSTFATPFELAAGGKTLPNENTGITRLWSRLLRDKAIAEEIIANVDNVNMEPEKKAGIKAYAMFFKAMTLGYLIQNFEKAPIDNSADGNAVFNDRKDVLNECVSLLDDAISSTTTESAAFINSLVSSEFSLIDVLNAYSARYNLFAGNYQDAINAADKVDLTSKSTWDYDGTNQKNPVFQFAVFDNPDTWPTDNFGLKGNLTPESNDGRLAFYLSPLDSVGTDETGSWAIDGLLGFFSAVDSSIPVYLPGEMPLVKAEAYARLGKLGDAVSQINIVRQKTDDVFGVNAGLDAWNGDASNVNSILDEIYRNRCAELFFSGMRLEDSRRIHDNFVPSDDADTQSERNRNFYPYPYEERINNKNIPADPSI